MLIHSFTGISARQVVLLKLLNVERVLSLLIIFHVLDLLEVEHRVAKFDPRRGQHEVELISTLT